MQFWLLVTVIVLLMVLVVFVYWKKWSQQGGAATSPGVYDQLNDKGPMDIYLTGL